MIPTQIKSISQSTKPTINTPLNKNDFVYVGDVAKAFTKAVVLDSPSGIYNLGSGNSTSVFDVCRTVEKHFLSTEPISRNVVDNVEHAENVNFWADMDKTKKVLNIICDTPLKEGIKRQIRSFLRNV